MLSVCISWEISIAKYNLLESERTVVLGLSVEYLLGVI
jgi:hypothetical protein